MQRFRASSIFNREFFGKLLAMRIFPLIAILFTTLVAGPAAAQDSPETPVPAIESDASSWRDLPDMYLSERAIASCSYGAVVGIGAAVLTSFLDAGITFGIQLIIGGAIVGCGAWLGEIGSEQFQAEWDRMHPAPQPGSGGGPGAGALPTQL